MKRVLLYGAILALLTGCYQEDYNSPGGSNGRPNPGSGSGYPSYVHPNEGIGGIGVEAPCQIYFEADGVPFSHVYDWNAGRNGYPESEVIGSSFYKESYYFTELNYPYADINRFIFRKGTLVFGTGTPTIEEFDQFFYPGAYPYAINADYGVEFTWFDGTGTLWSTSLGGGDQTGSSFEIVDMMADIYTTMQYVKIEADFNCRFYNAVGDTLTIENGKLITYHKF